MKKILSQIIITCFILTNLKAQTTDIRDNFVGVYTSNVTTTWYFPPPQYSFNSNNIVSITKSLTDSTAIIFTDTITGGTEILFCTTDSTATKYDPGSEIHHIYVYPNDSLTAQFSYFGGNGLTVQHLYYCNKITTALPEAINNDFYVTYMNSDKLVITTNTPNRMFSGEIYDLIGRIVVKSQYAGESITLDINGLPPSVYILLLTSRNSSFTYKFYKN
jgi:hypothetical protein